MIASVYQFVGTQKKYNFSDSNIKLLLIKINLSRRKNKKKNKSELYKKFHEIKKYFYWKYEKTKKLVMYVNFYLEEF